MKSKRIIVFAFLCIGLSNLSQGQDFYKDYRNYLIGNSKPNKKRVSSIGTSIKRLRIAINRFEHDNNKSFFLTDTIFIVGFQGSETATLSNIIWTKYACCYYQYGYELDNWKEANKKLTINTNAFDILKSFNNNFRDAIERIDTAAYAKYVDSHRVYDGEWVSPIIAIKGNGHWRFIGLKGNGWAINYDFEPRK